MGAMLESVKPLPGYRLQMTLCNGSMAVVDLSRRIKTVRFAGLSSAAVFNTARAEGDRVVWRNGDTSLSFYCFDLLDAMLLD